MLKLLSGLNNIQLWSHKLASDVELESGMFVRIENGEAVLPGDAGVTPFYLVFGDSNVPSVRGSGKIALLHGICRIETDQRVTTIGAAPVTYSPGDALTVNAEGKLTPAEAGQFVVGVVEAVTSEGLRVALTLNRTIGTSAAAGAVITLIDALPAVEALALVNEADVEAARAAYDALSDYQKDQVTNYADLEAAEAKISDLHVEAVETLITALPAVEALTLADAADVEAARAAYDALTAAQQAEVTNYDTLTAAEAVITALESLVTETANVEVATVNNAIPESIWLDGTTFKNTAGAAVAGNLAVSIDASGVHITADDFSAVYGTGDTGLQLSLLSAPVGATYYKFIDSLDSLAATVNVGECAGAVVLPFIVEDGAAYSAPRASGTTYLIVADDEGTVLEVRTVVFTVETNPGE